MLRNIMLKVQRGHGLHRTSRILTVGRKFDNVSTHGVELKCWQKYFGTSTPCNDISETGSVDDNISNDYSVTDSLFQLLANEDGLVSMTHLMHSLRDSGLWKNDPRLTESMARIKHYTLAAASSSALVAGRRDVMLTEEMFRDCIRDNIVLIRRAFTGNFVIPEFSKFCSVIDNIYWSCRTNSDGKVSSYIPQLARYSPDYWGVSLCTTDGQRHSIGDVDVPFTLQSGSMPLNYAVALNEVGAETVHKYVGHEPSGESFAHIKLNAENKPHNPLINSGAIMISSLIKQKLSAADKFDHMMAEYRRMAGGESLGFNNAVFLAEKERSHRNYALSYYMLENNCFPEGVVLEEVVDLYLQLSAIELNVNAGAVIAATLANGGYCPITGEKLLSSTSVRNTLSLMHSCGMYEYSGGFAFKVGLPAKSTVSGMILLVIPNVMGMCLWAPMLDRMGNSSRGVQFCEQLVHNFNFHHYDNLRRVSQKLDPRVRHVDRLSGRIVNLLFGAFNSDLTALRRMAIGNQDMSAADYDGRTALHVAASEGHLECVRFLVENCRVPVQPADRWNRTPYDDAVRFGRTDIAEYLRNFLRMDSTSTSTG